MEHNIKSWPESFEPVLEGVKTAEFRVNDRNYQVGDRVTMEEWLPGERRRTGRAVEVTISHIVRGPAYGIPDGFCMFSFNGRTVKHQAVIEP